MRVPALHTRASLQLTVTSSPLQLGAIVAIPPMKENSTMTLCTCSLDRTCSPRAMLVERRNDNTGASLARLSRLFFANPVQVQARSHVGRQICGKFGEAYMITSGL